MKSLTRTLLIVAGALIGTGFVLAIVGFAIGGFSWNAFNTAGPYEEKSQTYNAAEVSAITVDAKGCDVVLVGSDADEIKIDYAENKNGTWNIAKSADGKLSAKYQARRGWFNFSFGITTGERAITISVPAKYAGAIEASVASGDVRGSIAGKATDFTITANANSGDQNIVNSAGGDKHLNAATNSGDIAIEFDVSVQ